MSRYVELTVFCDGFCDNSLERDVTEHPGDDQAAEIEAAGWTADPDLCPECQVVRERAPEPVSASVVAFLLLVACGFVALTVSAFVAPQDSPKASVQRKFSTLEEPSRLRASAELQRALERASEAANQ